MGPDPGVFFLLSAVVCVCIVIPFILDVRFVDVPAGVTHEEGHTGFLIHLPSSTVKYFEFCVRTIESFSTY